MIQISKAPPAEAIDAWNLAVLCLDPSSVELLAGGIFERNAGSLEIRLTLGNAAYGSAALIEEFSSLTYRPAWRTAPPRDASRLLVRRAAESSAGAGEILLDLLWDGHDGFCIVAWAGGGLTDELSTAFRAIERERFSLDALEEQARIERNLRPVDWREGITLDQALGRLAGPGEDEAAAFLSLRRECVCGRIAARWFDETSGTWKPIEPAVIRFAEIEERRVSSLRSTSGLVYHHSRYFAEQPTALADADALAKFRAAGASVEQILVDAMRDGARIDQDSLVEALRQAGCTVNGQFVYTHAVLWQRKQRGRTTLAVLLGRARYELLSEERREEKTAACQTSADEVAKRFPALRFHPRTLEKYLPDSVRIPGCTLGDAWRCFTPQALEIKCTPENALGGARNTVRRSAS